MSLLSRLKEAASAAGPLRATVLIVVLVHVLGIFLYMTVWRTVRAPDFDVNDFKAYYTGALALSEGRPELLYPDPNTLNLGVLPDQEWVRFAMERGVPHPSGYIYPPFLAVVMQPVARLSYHRANQAWFVLNCLLFAAAVSLLMTWRPGELDFLAAAGILFVALNFYPTFRAFQCGQVSLMIFSMLAASFWLLRRDHQIASGALVGVAAAVKLTPAILILYFLAARRYRAAAGAGLAGGAALAVSLLGAGWANHMKFAGEILPALSRGAATFANQSLSGFLNRIGMETTMNAFQFVDEPRWLWLLSRAGSMAVLALSLYLGRRLALRGGGDGAAAGFALVVMGSLVASPISWEHHYIQSLVPLSLLIALTVSADRVPLWRAAALAVGYALVAANAYDLIRNHLPYGPGRLAISYALYGGALLWLLVATSRASERRTAEAG